jgi:hypothetical protein
MRDGSVFQPQLKDRVSVGNVLAMVLKTVTKRKKDERLLVFGIPAGVLL